MSPILKLNLFAFTVRLSTRSPRGPNGVGIGHSWHTWNLPFKVLHSGKKRWMDQKNTLSWRCITILSIEPLFFDGWWSSADLLTGVLVPHQVITCFTFNKYFSSQLQEEVFSLSNQYFLFQSVHQKFVCLLVWYSHGWFVWCHGVAGTFSIENHPLALSGESL